MSGSPRGSNHQRRFALRRAVSPPSYQYRHEQFRAACWYCLFTCRTQNGIEGELRHLLRPHPASRHIKCLTAGRLKYLVVQFSPTQTGAPLFPNVLTELPSSLQIKPNITRIDPDIENGYSRQANIQIDRELPGGAAISVGYLHLRARHLILSRNINVPTLPASAGIANLGRPDSEYGNIARYESSGDSSYDALVMTFNKRASGWTNPRVSYTLSKSTDTAGNFFFSSPQNNFDLRDELGPSDNDQRHRLTVSGSLEAPGSASVKGIRRAMKGLQLSYIFSYGSVLPFNILTGNDRNLDTNFNDRPVNVGRNAGRGFGSATFDLRLNRKFQLTERVRLEAIAEGFNVFNRANLQVPNDVFGTV